MLVTSQGMMNMFLWLTNLLMLVGKSKHRFRGHQFPKVSEYILVFTLSCLFPIVVNLSGVMCHAFCLNNAVVSYENRAPLGSLT